MDVLSLDLILPMSVASRKPLDRVRRRLRVLLTEMTGPGGDLPGGPMAAQRSGLFAYTASSIVLGLGLLAWTTVANPLWATIDPGLTDTALGGSNGGLLLWLMFGLLGSLRVLRTPDGGTMTFHMPFIGAAMVLGGPTAGAWVAFLSSIERRELSHSPGTASSPTMRCW